MTEVWMHKKNGELVLITPLYSLFGGYAARDLSNDCDYEIHINVDSKHYLFEGLGFENKHGVIFLLPLKVLKELDFIGEL